MIYETESLTSFLCDDILENIHLDNITDTDFDEFIIPKNNDQWNMIEKEIYKELLTHIVNYKNNLISINTVQSNNMIELLTKKMYCRNFTINKGKKLCNRYNVVSYLFCLDDSDIIINNLTFIGEKGKLFIFPEEYSVKCPISIFGQLCYENV